MKKLFLLATLVVFTLAMQGCGETCKKAKEEIIQPATTVQNYLNTNPSGQDLKQSGCPMMLAQFDNIPDASALMRKTADMKFSHTNAKCVDWRQGVRYHCYGDWISKINPPPVYHPPGHEGGHAGHHNPPPVYHPPYNPPYYPPHGPGHYNPGDCWPEEYSYCAAYEYETIHDPAYEVAIRLSQELDSMFAQAHQVCALAASANYDAAASGARDLNAYMLMNVKPDGDRVYAAAGCYKY
jgi:hypothetical protein